MNEIMQSPNPLRSYLHIEIGMLLANPTIEENIYAHLERNTASQRTQRILKIWKDISDQSVS